MKKLFVFMLLVAGVLAGCDGSSESGINLTNVSYDPTREFYAAFNQLFTEYWYERTGQQIANITTTHGGSGSQARSVINGVDADIVTLALEYDVNQLRAVNLIDDGWINRLERNSSPYTSTIAFLVRSGNPLNVQDWSDLVWVDSSGKTVENISEWQNSVRTDIGVITPDPKSSGGARWNFLAAWAYAYERWNGNEAAAQEFLTLLYGNVTVLDSGARGSTNTFVEVGTGDVLLAWENEAFLSNRDNPGQFEIITPSISILAQPSVSVVDAVVNRRGTREIAEAYLQLLYTDEVQRLVGRNFFRPSTPSVLAEFDRNGDTSHLDFAGFDLSVNLISIEDSRFGGWNSVSPRFFADGGIFDEIQLEIHRRR
jgi:sulfate transport system substrate-binding protein